MSQTSACDAIVGTTAPWREQRSTMWTHWKGRRSDRPREVDWHPRVADPSASESSSSGDDAQRTSGTRSGMCEASSDVEQEGDADSEPRGLGIDVEDAQVISKRDHAHAAAIPAERGDDADANRAWDDARRPSEDEDDVREVAFEFPVEN